MVIRATINGVENKRLFYFKSSISQIQHQIDPVCIECFGQILET